MGPSYWGIKVEKRRRQDRKGRVLEVTIYFKKSPNDNITFCCLTSYDKNDSKLVVVDLLIAPFHKCLVLNRSKTSPLRSEWVQRIFVSFTSRGDHRPPPTFCRSALIEHRFCSKERETMWKFKVWPYVMWNCNLPQQEPWYIQMKEERKRCSSLQSHTGVFCLVKGLWHNQPRKCVWWLLQQIRAARGRFFVQPNKTKAK